MIYSSMYIFIGVFIVWYVLYVFFPSVYVPLTEVKYSNCQQDKQL